MTFTLSKNASTAGRSFAIALIAPEKSSLATAAPASAFTRSIAVASVFSCSSEYNAASGAPSKLRLSFFSSMDEDVAGALGARQQVLAVVGIEEFSERLDAADHHQEIVLTAEREYGVDEIVPRALLAELNFQAIGEEGNQIYGAPS